MDNQANSSIENFRSNRSEGSPIKAILNIFRNSQENTHGESYTKIGLPHWCFLVNLSKIFRAVFLTNISEQMSLKLFVMYVLFLGFKVHIFFISKSIFHLTIML